MRRPPTRRARCTRYAHVDGADIAESMVELDWRHHEGARGWSFHVNESGPAFFEADAFWISSVSIIVFQHMNPQLIAGYLGEFVRIPWPGGVAMFNIPSHPDRFARCPLRRAPKLDPELLAALVLRL